MNQRLIIALMLLTASLSLGWGRSSDQYDQEARQQEKSQKEMDKAARAEQSTEEPSAAKNFAKGLKEVTVDNVKDTLSDTAKGTASGKPVVGTIDGAQTASEKFVDNTVKGVKKVVSLGYSKDESYEIDEPEKGSGDAAKIKLFQF